MILDASALLAYLLKEPGEDEVLKAIVSGARMSVVNFAEVAGRYSLRGASDEQVRAVRARLPFQLLPLDEETALEAGLMTRTTATSGLSLGDRCCLATAKLAGVPAMTADRAWTRFAAPLGIDVHLIR